MTGTPEEISAAEWALHDAEVAERDATAALGAAYRSRDARGIGEAQTCMGLAALDVLDGLTARPVPTQPRRDAVERTRSRRRGPSTAPDTTGLPR